MLWDDIVIGTGNKGNMASSAGMPEEINNISENSVSYWIDDCFLDVGMTIFKNTEEGDILTNLLKSKKPGKIKKINNFLDSLVVCKLSPSEIKKRIKKSNKKHFEMGEEFARKKIREVLGLRG